MGSWGKNFTPHMRSAPVKVSLAEKWLKERTVYNLSLIIVASAKVFAIC